MAAATAPPVTGTQVLSEMQCPTCGKSFTDGSQFCPADGTMLKPTGGGEADKAQSDAAKAEADAAAAATALAKPPMPPVPPAKDDSKDEPDEDDKKMAAAIAAGASAMAKLSENPEFLKLQERVALAESTAQDARKQLAEEKKARLLAEKERAEEKLSVRLSELKRNGKLTDGMVMAVSLAHKLDALDRGLTVDKKVLFYAEDGKTTKESGLLEAFIDTLENSPVGLMGGKLAIVYNDNAVAGASQADKNKELIRKYSEKIRAEKPKTPAHEVLRAAAILAEKDPEFKVVGGE
jgi:hypothetical protein